MANLPSAFSPTRNRNYMEQWNEQSEHRTLNSAGHQGMFNAAVPISQNEGFLSKPTNHRGDQNSISLKSNSSNEKKCQVYVHQFNKIPSKSTSNYVQNDWRSGSEIHQNMYKHEFSDFYDAKIRTFRRQFDNLSLQTRKPRTNSPNKIPKIHQTQLYNKHFAPAKTDLINQPPKIPYVKSSPNAKINKSFLFKPEHKAAVDKLEESYWAKWKPNKAPATKEPHPKMKGLYTENEKIKAPYHIINKNGSRERGDSNETIIQRVQLEKPETETANTSLVYVENFESTEMQQEPELEPGPEREPEYKPEAKYEENFIEDDIEISMPDENQDIRSNTATIIMSCDADTECNVGCLKHTDSFILTAKKQSQEKPHYQQPKCIKLFKNAGYSATATTNFVKGGSYTLKSCLKKENSAAKSSHLGRPGSPLKCSLTRKPGKANRFTK